MAYLGNTPSQQAFAPAVDYFNGNASTVAFTLSRPVASVAQVQVTIENVPQNPSSAFTVSGSTITFTSAPPSGTSNIYVQYTSPITTVIAPGQGTVNTTQLGSSLLVPVASGGTGSASTTYCSLTANVSGTLPVLNGGTGVTTSTGSGANVLGTSPTLVTPVLGTPTSGVLSNCTGTPIAKAWCYFTVTAGVVTLQNSFNVTSVTRAGTGLFIVNLTNAASNARLCGSVCCSINTAGTALMFSSLSSTTASTYSFYTLGSFLYSGAADPTDCNVTIFGS
jgi:hypothetical protein